VSIRVKLCQKKYQPATNPSFPARNQPKNANKKFGEKHKKRHRLTHLYDSLIFILQKEIFLGKNGFFQMFLDLFRCF
jgi:hypothetical protein